MRAKKLSGEFEALIERIFEAAYTVSTTLGHGFLDSVYKKALAEELTLSGSYVQTERAFSILYRSKIVGTYHADLVVEDQIIIELTAIDSLTREHSAKLMNYLKVSELPVGLLLNFGASNIEMKRVIRPV
jgi:GxxExxY protein